VISENQNTLTICVPTLLNRDSLFECVKSVQSQLDFRENQRIWIRVVVNSKGNFTINQQKRLEKLKKMNVEIAFHKNYMPTVELSALTALSTCESEWVWLLGDDDMLADGAITHVRDLVENKQVAFWLLNFTPVLEKTKLSYIDIGPRDIQFSDSVAVWRKLGFISATTTISCMLIRRNIVNIADFKKYHHLSGIYSHSVYLLSALHKFNSGLTNYHCVVRTEERPADIALSLAKFTNSSTGGGAYSFQIEGLLSLLRKLSKDLNISLKELLEFREIELIKNESFGTKDQKVLISTTGDFIRRAIENRIISVGPRSSDSKLVQQVASKNRSQLVLQTPVRVSL